MSITFVHNKQTYNSKYIKFHRVNDELDNYYRWYSDTLRLTPDYLVEFTFYTLKKDKSKQRDFFIDIAYIKANGIDLANHKVVKRSTYKETYHNINKTLEQIDNIYLNLKNSEFTTFIVTTNNSKQHNYVFSGNINEVLRKIETKFKLKRGSLNKTDWSSFNGNLIINKK